MRCCLCLLALAAFLFAGDPQSETLRGKLVLAPGKNPAIETSDRKLVMLDGDDSTRKVLADQRLNGYAVEARGHYTAPGHFLIDPFHTRGLVARRDGKIKVITYFCDVCSIRAYTPGPCACCQRETTLELKDPDQLDH
jgi:hypothetical protein